MPFTEIDKQFSKSINDFENILKSLDFDLDQSIEFTLSSDLKAELDNAPKEKGLYYFEMKIPKNHLVYDVIDRNLFNFKKVWKDDPKVSSFWSPGVKKKRCIKANERIESHLNEGWIPLYLGKSECIVNRVKQHLFQDPAQASFAMKLLARTDLYGIQFRLSTLPIQVENSKMILPYVEDYLRSVKNPILGQ